MGKSSFIRPASFMRKESSRRKLRDDTLPGRGGDWLKMKCLHEQEFVVGGFTLPSNGIQGVGALLLGYYRDGKIDLCRTHRHRLYAEDTQIHSGKAGSA